MNAATPPGAWGRSVISLDCEAVCRGTGNCTSWTWHDPKQGEFARMCVMRADGVWAPAPSAQGGHTSGRLTDGPVAGGLPVTSGLYVADLASMNLDDVTGTPPLSPIILTPCPYDPIKPLSPYHTNTMPL